MSIRTLRATLAHAPTPDRLELLPDHLVTVDDGTIVDLRPAGPDDRPDVALGADRVVLPGFVDTHFHAPQWPQLGTGLDRPLEQWLFDHTFPLESSFADVDRAIAVWDEMVPTLLALGTTTVVYHSSIHVEATTALAEACVRHGQRALVGRVAMDHPTGTPEWYRDASAAEAVDRSARSIEGIRALGSPLVQPIVTPRFAPACSDAALAGLGELAAATGVATQTHCSESDWAHGYSLERFGVTDAEALDRFGLLRDHTVLAHATHLTDDDRARLVATGAGVAHCPLSNAYFADSVFPLRRAMAAGVRVGLGTDVAGGATASMAEQCGHAVTVSRMLEAGVDVERPTPERGRPDSRIDLVTAFHLATAGGADLCGLPVGSFALGRRFDAQAWRATPDATGIEQALRRADPRDVETVWVDGRVVAGA